MKQDQFLALVVSEDTSKTIHREIQQKNIKDLPTGDVLVQVFYSSLNYKDALSASGNRGVTKHYPHTPGIDAAGVVVASSSPRWTPGDEVICTGYDLGMNTAGGFGQFIRVPSAWLVHKPAALSLLETMQLGTAGFTAALCLLGLVTNGVTPGNGPVLVTGATGGVATVAIMLLVKAGYQVTAVSGKDDAHVFLAGLGVSEVINRQVFLADSDRGLLPSRWAGVIDTVGGQILATAIKGTGFDGVVTCCGNAASGELPLNVYPFILRGVHLLGVYSANCPMEKRLRVWARLGQEWKLDGLKSMCRIVGLDELDHEISKMLAGKSTGRCVVKLGD